MTHNKKKEAGRNDRLKLLRTEFPDIQQHLLNRPPGVGKDYLLDGLRQRGLRSGGTGVKPFPSSTSSATCISRSTQSGRRRAGTGSPLRSSAQLSAGGIPATCTVLGTADSFSTLAWDGMNTSLIWRD
jgi:hypothetical protein